MIVTAYNKYRPISLLKVKEDLQTQLKVLIKSNSINIIYQTLIDQIILIISQSKKFQSKNQYTGMQNVLLVRNLTRSKR